MCTPSKLSFFENSLWVNVLNHLETKVTPKNPHACIFFSMILKKWVLINLILLVLGFFSSDFFNFALKTYGTLTMLLLSAQNKFYIILSSYVERACEKNSSLNQIFGWFPGLQNLDAFLGKFFVALAWKSFSIIFNSL